MGAGKVHPHTNTNGRVLNKSDLEGGRYSARGWRLRAEPRWMAYSFGCGCGVGVGVMERWWRWRWRSEGGVRGGRLMERMTRTMPCAVERGGEVGEYGGLLRGSFFSLVLVVPQSFFFWWACYAYGSSRRTCKMREVEPRDATVRYGRLAEGPMRGSIGVSVRWKDIFD